MPRLSQHAQYTFTDKHGKLYRSAPGEEYGTLTPVAFSASTDRPGAFSDGENPKVQASGTTPKLTLSDFWPPSAMTSASASLDQYTPAPPLGVYLTGVVGTALPKMQGVVQSIHRTITSACSKGSANDASPPPLHEAGEISASNTASPVDASVEESKSFEPRPKV